jgi:hypothetical protein
VIGLAALALGLVVWLSNRKDGGGGQGPNGAIVAADGEARASDDRVLLEIVVQSLAEDTRLFEVAWRMSHPNWVRIGDTLLREIAPGQTESYALIENAGPFKKGERIAITLTLFSRPIDGGNPVQEDLQEFTLRAV